MWCDKQHLWEGRACPSSSHSRLLVILGMYQSHRHFGFLFSSLIGAIGNLVLPNEYLDAAYGLWAKGYVPNSGSCHPWDVPKPSSPSLLYSSLIGTKGTVVLPNAAYYGCEGIKSQILVPCSHSHFIRRNIFVATFPIIPEPSSSLRDERESLSRCLRRPPRLHCHLRVIAIVIVTRCCNSPLPIVTGRLWYVTVC